MAEPFWTRMLWPRPRSFPSFDTRAAPIFGMNECQGLKCIVLWVWGVLRELRLLCIRSLLPRQRWRSLLGCSLCKESLASECNCMRKIDTRTSRNTFDGGNM